MIGCADNFLFYIITHTVYTWYDHVSIASYKNIKSINSSIFLPGLSITQLFFVNLLLGLLISHFLTFPSIHLISSRHFNKSISIKAAFHLPVTVPLHWCWTGFTPKWNRGKVNVIRHRNNSVIYFSFCLHSLKYYTIYILIRRT